MNIVFAIVGVLGTMSDWPGLYPDMTPEMKKWCYLLSFLAHVYMDIVERMLFVCKKGPPIKWLLDCCFVPFVRWITRRR